jgi:hypothetical protein
MHLRDSLSFTTSIVVLGGLSWIILFSWLFTFRSWEEATKTAGVSLEKEKNDIRRDIRKRYRTYLIIASVVGLIVGITGIYEYKRRARKMFYTIVNELQLKGFTRKEALHIAVKRTPLRQLLVIFAQK